MSKDKSLHCVRRVDLFEGCDIDPAGQPFCGLDVLVARFGAQEFIAEFQEAVAENPQVVCITDMQFVVGVAR